MSEKYESFITALNNNLKVCWYSKDIVVALRRSTCYVVTCLRHWLRATTVEQIASLYFDMVAAGTKAFTLLELESINCILNCDICRVRRLFCGAVYCSFFLSSASRKLAFVFTNNANSKFYLRWSLGLQCLGNQYLLTWWCSWRWW